MTTILHTPRRRRRHPHDVQVEAIAAARRLLVTDGPSAVTLQGVAAALNMAHGNITHHFGSAANLQAALADTLIADLLAAVCVGTNSLRSGVIQEADLVDLIFDTFEENGVGRLIAWLASQGSHQLQSMYERFGALPFELTETAVEGSLIPREDLPPIIASIVMTALGTSLIGGGMLSALGLPATFMREQVVEALIKQRQAGGSVDHRL